MKIPIICPNTKVTPTVWWLVVAGWLALSLGYWGVFRPEIFPSPLEVLQAIPYLLMEEGLLDQLTSSMAINLQALFYSTIISLGLAYLSTLPVAKPLVAAIQKFRFVSPAIFFFVFAHMFAGESVKTAIMVTGITVFFTTTMVGAVHDAIQSGEALDHARTLRKTEWQTVWYVIIRGTVAEAVDALRENAAMGWAMLTMVEGIARDGGVGVMILDNTKHFNFANVYAVALVILAVGILQDYLLSVVKVVVAPYAV